MTPDTLHDLDNSGDATISQRAAAACLHRDDGDHHPRAASPSSCPASFSSGRSAWRAGPLRLEVPLGADAQRCDGCSSPVLLREGGAERAGL